MSHRLISRNADLKRLRDEGYDVRIRAGHLLLNDVPYVNTRREVKRGMLVSALTTAGDVTVKPGTHVIHFAGEYPCHKDGSPIEEIRHASRKVTLGEGLARDHSFSNKPKGGYSDFYEKMTTYANILSGPAEALDPSVTARTFPTFEALEEETVFNYIDTASSRAGIGELAPKLELGKIGIVGLGGTGSYILDLVAKTPVKEIHLFDGDVFSSHNAFRAPGAASIEELRAKPKKASYFQQRYALLRRGIYAHDEYVDEANVDRFRDMDFMFLCLDQGSAKRLIIETLEGFGTSFIDVGMGLQLVEGSLVGLLRTTTSTTEQRRHVHDKNRISLSDNADDNEYAQNIQIADLNALNAALAVIKWKKLYGFYLDLEREFHSAYTLDGNTIINEDQL